MGTSSTSKTHQLSVPTRVSGALTAKMWVENPPVAPVADSTRGLPVSLTLLPVGFHAARVKLARFKSMISPPNPAHQSPAVGSVCLVTGNGEVEAKMARVNNGATDRVNVPRKPTEGTRSRQQTALGCENVWGICGEAYEFIRSASRLDLQITSGHVSRNSPSAAR